MFDSICAPLVDGVEIETAEHLPIWSFTLLYMR